MTAPDAVAAAGIQSSHETSANGSNGAVIPKTLLGVAATGSGFAAATDESAPPHEATVTSEAVTADDGSNEPAADSDVDIDAEEADDVGDIRAAATDTDPANDPEWDPAGEIDTTITGASNAQQQHLTDGSPAIASTAASNGSLNTPTPPREGTAPDAPATPTSPAAPEAVATNEEPDKEQRRKPWLLVALAGLLAMALGAGGAYLYLANQERQERQAAEAGAVTIVQGTFDQLATVSNTADVRRVAGEAEASRGQLNVNEESPTVVTSADAALATVAALASLNGDTLDTWPTMRAQIETAVGPVATSETAVAAGPGIEAVETVVTKGKDTLALWFMQAIADKNANTEALGAVDRYESAVNVQISRYNELRREASDWVDRARIEGSYRASDAERFFTQASSDRRAVRDSLSALTPPPGLEAQHAELLAVLTAGIDGIESMLDGLYDNDICRYDCYLSQTTGYQQFQIASGQITQRYGLAVDNFRAAIAARKAELANTGGPPKPEV